MSDWFNKFSKWITSFGDWNHAVVAAIFIWPVALIMWLPSLLVAHFLSLSVFFSVCALIASLLFHTGYYGREVTSAQYSGLRGLDAFNWNKWARHDRVQQQYLMIVGKLLSVVSALIGWILLLSHP